MAVKDNQRKKTHKKLLNSVNSTDTETKFDVVVEKYLNTYL